MNDLGGSRDGSGTGAKWLRTSGRRDPRGGRRGGRELRHRRRRRGRRADREDRASTRSGSVDILRQQRRHPARQDALEAWTRAVGRRLRCISRARTASAGPLQPHEGARPGRRDHQHLVDVGPERQLRADQLRRGQGRHLRASRAASRSRARSTGSAPTCSRRSRSRASPRICRASSDEKMKARMNPALVSPLVVYLASDLVEGPHRARPSSSAAGASPRCDGDAHGRDEVGAGGPLGAARRSRTRSKPEDPAARVGRRARTRLPDGVCAPLAAGGTWRPACRSGGSGPGRRISRADPRWRRLTRSPIRCSAMTPRFNFFFRWFARRFFTHFGLDDEVRRAACARSSARGSVVYVMRYASRLDYFLFNALFLREGLRLSALRQRHPLLRTTGRSCGPAAQWWRGRRERAAEPDEEAAEPQLRARARARRAIAVPVPAHRAAASLLGVARGRSSTQGKQRARPARGGGRRAVWTRQRPIAAGAARALLAQGAAQPAALPEPLLRRADAALRPREGERPSSRPTGTSRSRSASRSTCAPSSRTAAPRASTPSRARCGARS